MNEVRNVIVGFDFGEDGSQLCYYDRREAEPVSVPVKVGTGEYVFKNCLSKKTDSDLWHFGPETDFFVRQKNEILVPDLYHICQKKETVQVDGKEYQAGELLGIFILKSLSMLGLPDPLKSISSLMVTTPKLSRTMVGNIRTAMQFMGFDKKRCFIQDYEESFYVHTLYQKQELWSRNVALFVFKGNEVSYSWLSVDKNNKQNQVTIKRGSTTELPEEAEDRDQEFYIFAKDCLGSHVFSSIYIMGDGFSREWAKERSVPLLCRHQRHVFQGNNLFCKGACYGAKEKVEEKNLKGYIFSGNDMVQFNIGMDMIVSGVNAYHPLIKAGVNWYEASGECEILLDDVKDLMFVVTDMANTQKKRYAMSLPGLPDRPAKASRLHLIVEFSSVTECQIKVEDMGFGDMYPSSGMVWQDIIVNEGGQR